MQLTRGVEPPGQVVGVVVARVVEAIVALVVGWVMRVGWQVVRKEHWGQPRHRG